MPHIPRTAIPLPLSAWLACLAAAPAPRTIESWLKDAGYREQLVTEKLGARTARRGLSVHEPAHSQGARKRLSAVQGLSKWAHELLASFQQ